MHTRLTVRDMMAPDPVVVTADRTIGEVLPLMNDRRIGSVLVCDHSRRLLGIFTERDLLKRVGAAEPGWRSCPVADWMTPDPYVVGPDVSGDEVVQMMDQLGVRRLPVVENGRVVGLVSTRMLIARRAEVLNQQVEARTAELRQAIDELLARDHEVLYNLRAAGQLQRKLLPHAPPDWPEVRWEVHYAPLDHLGGDYYDFAVPSPDHLGFLIADASGHSVAAAMVAILTRFAFAEASRHTTSPGQVLSAINQRLQGVTEERFVTAFYGVYDRRTRTLRYANAGHPYPLRWEAATGEVKPLAASGFILGVVPDEVYAEKEVRLAPGDAICFYTDGLIESRNEIGELFGEERVMDCLGHAAAGDEDLLDHLLRCRRRFSSDVPLSDDLTAAICRLPNG